MAGHLIAIDNLDGAAAEVARRVSASVAEVCARGAGGGGAGTIWRSDGAIVTNHHVVPDDEAEVTLADGRTFAATVVARDQENDLALLSVPARDLPAATPGDARALRAGDLVLAVGHPWGMRGAVTIGVVKRALEASSSQKRELVAADVRLGPGNSGGPLADARGRVVGINAMVSGPLALAVPSHLVMRLVAGPQARPSLGIGAVDIVVPPALAARARVSSGRGVLVAQVGAESPAERAGILIGDVLVALEGRPLDGTDALQRALEAHSGGAVAIHLLRGGVPLDLVAQLARSERRAA